MLEGLAQQHAGKMAVGKRQGLAFDVASPHVQAQCADQRRDPVRRQIDADNRISGPLQQRRHVARRRADVQQRPCWRKPGDDLEVGAITSPMDGPVGPMPTARRIGLRGHSGLQHNERLSRAFAGFPPAHTRRTAGHGWPSPPLDLCIVRPPAN